MLDYKRWHLKNLLRLLMLIFSQHGKGQNEHVLAGASDYKETAGNLPASTSRCSFESSPPSVRLGIILNFHAELAVNAMPDPRVSIQNIFHQCPQQKARLANIELGTQYLAKQITDYCTGWRTCIVNIYLIIEYNLYNAHARSNTHITVNDNYVNKFDYVGYTGAQTNMKYCRHYGRERVCVCMRART